MDMDSTLITIECIDEIADFCGLKTQVAEITEASMRGEIRDFNESLTRRVARCWPKPTRTRSMRVRTVAGRRRCSPA